MSYRTFVKRDRNFFLNLITTAVTHPHLRQTHAQIILNGFKSDLSTITKLIQKLSDLGSISYATQICSNFPNPDLFLYNVIIRAYSRNNHHSNSLSIYRQLRHNTSLVPDSFTYAFVISAASKLSCHNLGDKLGLTLHGHAIVGGVGLDLFVGSAVVDMYLSFGNVGYAHKVFDEMPEPDTVLCNTMISGSVKNGCFDEAVLVFKDMVLRGTRMDSTSFAAVLTAVAELQELKVGMAVESLSVKVGFHGHVHVVTGFISLYAKCGNMITARRLFEEVEFPDIIAYNAMISGSTCNREMANAVDVFKQVMGLQHRVNSSTIVGLIPVFYPFGHLILTGTIHSFSLKSNLLSKTSVATALITVYSRLNEIDSARKLFDECLDKSLAAWNAMISGYAQNGLTDNAITLFQEMQKFKIAPNPTTITSILSACAQLGALSLGKRVHDLASREGFESNVYVSTALIDMYAKCGSIQEARQVFDTITEKNPVTWNAMISGYGLHGLAHEALKIFNKMVDLKVPLTGVTFVSVLYACSHAGLVTEGEEIFNKMVQDHGFKPLPEHYACMVDLYGRSGELHKALTFINNMPVDPGPETWGALLSACKTHKNTDLARLASDKLFELDPENVGYHVLLSNIHTADKNYHEAASVRQVVRNQKLVKTPGCTLIEVNKIPHVFTSGQRSHDQTDTIYAMLERLMGKMKEAGFQTDTVTALHDVEDEEKELMVNVHSEKLAIAFGLLNTETRSEIRIMKNLRVCIDCHEFTKFVSKVTERVIVVRDANRFHHFEDGKCSCGDYW
ncbi:putative tetratricopeptide-like helical domain superfamily, DYW domain-containing protein [Helianthus annuus]|nr:putative tetratricopeptide-like helical domain superfamily, DYW domain-containing protein [Helianthus annuus]